MERLAGQVNRDGAAATPFRQSLAQTMKLLISDHYPARPRRVPAAIMARHLGPRAQQTVADYLQSQLDSRVDLDELTVLVDMTVNVFLCAFSAAFGTTPHQYLIEQRIERAKACLWGSRASITDTSASVGFSNPSHFATTFKKRVGVSPSAFRRDTSQAAPHD
jgi:AraC family transcriptional regulator